MPYIDEYSRERLKTEAPVALNPGELNYQITKVIAGYLNGHGKHYTTINDVLGALEGAKLEFYRRVVVPYENEKLSINGDVY